MLEGERVQQREQAVAKTYRVELACHLFSGTYRRVNAGERGSLLIERDPDVRDMRDWLVVKEVVGPCVAVMAGQRNVNAADQPIPGRTRRATSEAAMPVSVPSLLGIRSG